jgi:starch-binding outer membrane protein, SusD/RagB family
MKMKKMLDLLGKKAMLMLVILAISFSCTDDLDVTPQDDDDFTAEKFYENPQAYRMFLAKLYLGLAKAGNGEGDGGEDLAGIRNDFSPYLRAFYTLQQLPTDESVIAWQDGNLPSMNTHTWTSNNEFIYVMYSRTFYQISLANEFLRQSTAEKLASRTVDPAILSDMPSYRAEARFLRALSLYHAMDLFGRVPILTENDPVGFFYPQQKEKAEVFDFLVSELNDMDADLKESRTNEYGRVDKIAAKMLLAKLYLNAETYIGESKYAEAATALADVLNSNYQIANVPYSYLFMADNDVNGAQNEFIFPVRFDGQYTTSGGTNYLVHASILSSMNASDFGVDGGWKGLRARREFVNKFDDVTGASDSRAMFQIEGQSLDIASVADETQGYGVRKWTNKKSDGSNGSSPSGAFVDTDFPMFRLADAYLMYAELAVRGQGSLPQAVTYVNALRTRANASTISTGDLNLDFVLAERSRELYWECHRRQDLIRFGKFTGGSYLWQWKGNSANGAAISDNLKLFPIPDRAKAANPTLVQNSGY